MLSLPGQGQAPNRLWLKQNESNQIALCSGVAGHERLAHC